MFKFTTVTLDVTPDEARRVMAGREVGKLTALLRAPGDVQPGQLQRSDAYAELGLGGGAQGRSARPPTVAVIHGAANPRLYTVRSAAPPEAARMPAEPSPLDAPSQNKRMRTVASGPAM